MSRDEIVRMAREAHRQLVTLDYPGHLGQLDPWTMQLLERFAALVAAAERDAILQMSNEQWFKTQADFEAAIRARGQE